MSTGRKDIAKSWFGYRARECESYLRKIELLQAKEARELEENLLRQRALNESLKEEADRSEQRLRSVPPALADELRELSSERLQRSVDAIERQGEAEAESLRLLRHRKEAEYERRLNEMEKQMQEDKDALDFLLNEASDWLIKLKSGQAPDSGEESEPESEAAMQVIANASFTEWEEREEEEREEAEEAQAMSSANVLQFKLRSILNRAEEPKDSAAAIPSAMTADGTSIAEPIAPKATGSDANPPVRPAQKPKSATSFWGDAEDAMEEPIVHAAFRAGFAQEVPPEDGFLPVETTAEILTETGTPTEIAASAEARTGAESRGLTDEIKAVQNRYIVGKTAGETLVASNGHTIVAKGQTITGDIVQAADREGKLPELIVNMVIPGLGSEPS